MGSLGEDRWHGRKDSTRFFATVRLTELNLNPQAFPAPRAARAANWRSGRPGTDRRALLLARRREVMPARLSVYRI
jgi:hypothetical protein